MYAGAGGSADGTCGCCAGSVGDAAGGVDVALSPGCDFRSSGEDDGAGGVYDGGLAAGEVDVVDDEGSAGGWDAAVAVGCHYAFGSVGKGGVLEKDGSDGLVKATVGHVDADSTVVDRERLEGP